MDISTRLIEKAYNRYKQVLSHYNIINKYYYGSTDSLKNFKPMEGRSNLKVNTNFVQKLVDEEAAYSFGNTVTYIPSGNNNQISKDIEYNLRNNQEDQDMNLGIELIKNGICYEINYLDKDQRFKNRKISPLNGYMYRLNEEPIFFMHCFSIDELDTEKEYIDVYTDREIIHLDINYVEVAQRTTHYFGIVPVGYGIIGGTEYNRDRGYIEGDKTIFRTIKTLQDAYETNFSDIVSEISDFRNAILKLFNARQLENGDGTKQPIIRDNAVMEFDDKETQDAQWLIKDINDTFIKNTRDDLKDLIYTLSCHIDNNEKMPSNLSGIALRSRLQMLESKCRMNEKAMANILRTRLKCLFKYLFQTESKDYDANSIKIQFTPNVPVDVTSNADLVSKVPHEVMSYSTKRTLFPFISDSVAEQKQIDAENNVENGGIDIDNIDNDATDHIIGERNE